MVRGDTWHEYLSIRSQMRSTKSQSWTILNILSWRPPLRGFPSFFSPQAITSSGETRLLGVPRKVCIIGGGIAGLTAAFELLEIATKLKCPIDITIIERRPRCGGRILTHRNYSPLISEG